MNEDINNKIIIITNKMKNDKLSFIDALNNISKLMNFNNDIINNINKSYRLDSILPYNQQNFYHEPYILDLNPDEYLLPVDKICAHINNLLKDNQFNNWDDAANYTCKNLNISFDNLLNKINELRNHINNDNVSIQIYIEKNPVIKVNLITESFDKFNKEYKKYHYDEDILIKAKNWIKYKRENLI